MVAEKLPDGAVLRLGEYKLRGRGVDGLTFSPDGKKLLAASTAYSFAGGKTLGQVTVHRWDARTGGLLAPVEFDPGPPAVARVFGDRLFLLGSKSEPPAFGTVTTVRTVALPSKKKAEDGKTFDLPQHASFPSPISTLPQALGSADGERLAVVAPGREESEVLVYDATTGTKLHALTADAHSYQVRFSPDGKTCAVLHAGVRRFDLKAGRELPTLEGSGGTDLAFSPDGKFAAVCGETLRNVVKGVGEPAGAGAVWDVSEPAKPIHRPEVDGPGWGVAFAADDGVLIGHSPVGKEMALSRWSAKTGKRDWTVPVPFDALQPGYRRGRLVVSPDGRTAAVTDLNQITALFDACTGKRLDVTTAHDTTVRWVAYTDDGKTIRTATDADVKSWDATSGKLLSTANPDGLADPVFVGSTGKLLVWWGTNKGGKKEAVAVDAATGKRAWAVEASQKWTQKPVVGDGRVVLLGAGVERFVKQVLVYAEDGKKEAEWEMDDEQSAKQVGRVNLLVDGELFIGGYPSKGAAVAVLGVDVTDGKEKRRLPPLPKPDDREYIAALVPADGGKVVVTARRNGWVALDSKTGAEAAREDVNVMRGGLIQVVASAGGRRVLAHGARETTAWLIDPTGKTEAKPLDSRSGVATALAFSPDGKRAVVGYRDGTALIWDVSK